MQSEKSLEQTGLGAILMGRPWSGDRVKLKSGGQRRICPPLCMSGMKLEWQIQGQIFTTFAIVRGHFNVATNNKTTRS